LGVERKEHPLTCLQKNSVIKGADLRAEEERLKKQTGAVCACEMIGRDQGESMRCDDAVEKRRSTKRSRTPGRSMVKKKNWGRGLLFRRTVFSRRKKKTRKINLNNNPEGDSREVGVSCRKKGVGWKKPSGDG